MVKIKFKMFGANSAIGGFAPGDTMRCGEALAQHFVDTGVAVFDEVSAKPAPVELPVEAPAATRRNKAK